MIYIIFGKLILELKYTNLIQAEKNKKEKYKKIFFNTEEDRKHKRKRAIHNKNNIKKTKKECTM